MPKLAQPWSLVLALGGALLIALLAIAFLLGRETVRAPQPETAARSTTTTATPVAPLPPPSVELPRAALPAAPGMPRLPSAPAVDGGASPLRAGVAAYFDAVDHLQPGELPADGEGFAGEVLRGALAGDASRFNAFLRQAEESRTALLRIAPPPPCREYHRQALALIDDGIAVLKTLSGALAGGDTSGLAGAAMHAGALQGRMKELQTEEQAIRVAYGVPQAPRAP